MDIAGPVAEAEAIVNPFQVRRIMQHKLMTMDFSVKNRVTMEIKLQSLLLHLLCT